MLSNNMDFMEILKTIAVSLNASSVSLINDKKYRFYLIDGKVIDIPKKELELEFLQQVKINVVQ